MKEKDMTTQGVVAVPATVEPTLPAQIEETTEIGSVLRLAVEKGADVETMQGLYALYKEERAARAKAQFDAALADFKRRCPPIPRRGEGVITGGVRFSYPELEDIQAIADPILGELGFSYDWDQAVSEKMMEAVCTLTHSSGHSKSRSFKSTTEGPGAKMHDIQMANKAFTMLRRITLIQVLGLKVGDPDLDGETPQGAITPDQAVHIEDLLRETKSDRARFLRAFGAESVETMPASAYRLAITMLEAKRK